MFQGVITGRVKFKQHQPLDANLQDLLPRPNGVWIRVFPLEALETTKGGLQLDKQSIEDEERGVTIGYVDALGTHAYEHDKYNGKQYCKEGDYVLFARHQGLDFEMKGRHFKLLQDDRPLMTFTLQQLIDLDIVES